MKLTPSQQKVFDHLKDGRWHCMADSRFFMKDDRKRISELNEMGFNIIGFKCDKRCGVKHSSRILMRKMKGVPEGIEAPVSPKTAPQQELRVVGVMEELDPWTGAGRGVYHDIYESAV